MAYLRHPRNHLEGLSKTIEYLMSGYREPRQRFKLGTSGIQVTIAATSTCWVPVKLMAGNVRIEVPHFPLKWRRGHMITCTTGHSKVGPVWREHISRNYRFICRYKASSKFQLIHLHVFLGTSVSSGRTNRPRVSIHLIHCSGLFIRLIMVHFRTQYFTHSNLYITNAGIYSINVVQIMIL